MCINLVFKFHHCRCREAVGFQPCGSTQSSAVTTCRQRLVFDLGDPGYPCPLHSEDSTIWTSERMESLQQGRRDNTPYRFSNIGSNQREEIEAQVPGRYSTFHIYTEIQQPRPCSQTHYATASHNNQRQLSNSQSRCPTTYPPSPFPVTESGWSQLPSSAGKYFQSAGAGKMPTTFEAKMPQYRHLWDRQAVSIVGGPQELGTIVTADPEDCHRTCGPVQNSNSHSSSTRHVLGWISCSDRPPPHHSEQSTLVASPKPPVTRTQQLPPPLPATFGPPSHIHTRPPVAPLHRPAFPPPSSHDVAQRILTRPQRARPLPQSRSR